MIFRSIYFCNRGINRVMLEAPVCFCLMRLITYLYPLFGDAYCVNFIMMYLILIESGNELYDHHKSILIYDNAVWL
jgi:hypothetical protein